MNFLPNEKTSGPEPGVNAGDGYRILAFSYSPPSVVNLYIELVRRIQQFHQFKFYFIVINSITKLLFLKQGMTAFTLSELFDKHSRPLDFELSDQLLDEFSDFDRTIGRKWPLPGPPLVLDPSDPEKSYFRSAGRRYLAAWDLLFKALAPHAVFSWNLHSLPTSTMIWLARQKGLPVFFLERGLLPDTLVIDPQGVNYGSHLAGPGWSRIKAPRPSPEEVKLARSFCEKWRKQGATIVRTGRSLAPDKLREDLKIPSSARVALFPLQIENDSNIITYSPHFKAMPEIIRRLDRALSSIDNAILLVKPHPEDKNRLAELKALAGPSSRVSMDYELHSLLELSNVAVTVNSTVGLEALTHHKPVVVLGKAIYGEKGFTFDLERPDQLEELVRLSFQAADKGEFNEAEFYRFLVYLLKRGLFSVEDDDPWRSREYLSGRIIEACARARVGKPDPDLLDTNTKLIRSLINFLRPGPEREEKTRVLLLTSNPELIGFFEKECASLGYEPPDCWQKSPGFLLKILTRKYDYSIEHGEEGRLVRIMRPWLRVKERIRLR